MRGDGLYLTDGGIETVLIYDEGFELPAFAAFPLLDDEAGITAARGRDRPGRRCRGADTLDSGDPADPAALRDKLPRLRVLGGCCGTDHRHIGAIADAYAQS